MIVLPPQFDEMRSEPRWVGWRSEKAKSGRTTKVPYTPGAGRRARSNDPATWGTFEKAAAMRGIDGIAYCLHGHVSRAGVDLDHCRDTTNGTIAEWADKLIAAASTYCEVSPSGTGFHLVGDVANVAPDDFKLARGPNGEAVDVFVRSTRFLTVTGQVFADLPFADISPVILDLQAERTAKQSQHGNKAGARDPDELGPEIAKLIRDGGPAGTDRSRLLYRVIAVMHRAGFTRGDIIAVLAAHATGVASHALEKGGHRELERQVDRTLAKLPQKAVIAIAGYTQTAAAVEKAIVAAGLPLFRRDTLLVLPSIRTVKGTHNTETKSGALIRVGDARLRQFMDEAADFTQKAAKKWVTVRPPKDIAELILARADCWPFPHVHGVITAPTLRSDGSVLDQPGFDPVTGLYVIALPGMPALSRNPDRSEAALALTELRSLIEEFPFADEASKSIALDAMITPIVRAAFDVTPMKVFSAPTAGTGKTFAVDIAATIATGFRCPVQSWSIDERENDKALVGAALSGYPLLSIDNVNGLLGSSFLCQLIERPLIEIRPLGTSDKYRIEPRGLTLYATGNNITITGDLVRRTLVASLDAREEDPYRRTFKRDPLAMVMADRGRYIAAAITICRAYRLAGSPGRLPSLASFEGWSDTVRSALVWLGCADPADTIAATKADDPEYEHISIFYETWREEILLNVELTVAQLIAGTQKPERDLPTRWPKMREALLAVAAVKGSINADRLGKRLRNWRNRIIDNLQLVKTGASRGKPRWTLRQIQ